MRAPTSLLGAALLTLVVGLGCASASHTPDADGWSNEEAAGFGVAMEAAPMSRASAISFADDSMAGDFAAPVVAAAPPPPPPPPPPEQKTSTTTTTTTSTTTASTTAPKRLVIYTGSVSTIVPQVEPGLATFVAKVAADGGYLQSRNGNSVTVRVPANAFFTTIDWLRKNGQVSDENVNALDVTKRVFDIELRLQTAEESRKRLLKLLETATKTEDILKIEQEVRRLTDEIEGMKGELRTLGDQVAFSTLTVTFFADAPPPNPYPQRTRSRFEWINKVGIERVLGSF